MLLKDDNRKCRNGDDVPDGASRDVEGQHLVRERIGEPKGVVPGRAANSPENACVTKHCLLAVWAWLGGGLSNRARAYAGLMDVSHAMKTKARRRAVGYTCLPSRDYDIRHLVSCVWVSP